MAKRRLSFITRVCGLCLLIGSLPWTLRLVWEMTLLSWRQGPQMVGFSVAHTMPGFLFFGVLFTLAAAAWCIVVGLVAVLRMRSLARLDWALFVATFLTVGAQLVPYSAWQWVTIQALGFPKLDSPAGRALYDTLVTAVRNGDAHMVESLFSRGLDVNGPDRNGTTALYAAASAGQSQMVAYLLQRGAHVNLQNNKQETALHAAAQNGHLETVKVLMAGGADPTIRTSGGKGFSAADMAWSMKNFSVSEFLDAQEHQHRGRH